MADGCLSGKILLDEGTFAFIGLLGTNRETRIVKVYEIQGPLLTMLGVAISIIIVVKCGEVVWGVVRAAGKAQQSVECFGPPTVNEILE